ncbi:CbiX/SirB N-terminal domain-containing protein [Corynebacterium breve]|uniref:CbiX/SirB N-terminal domain-containing protein n=1 Tax=Corynebacterium breve TaxID=3049799 RepID=A0ABY8VIT0_9CORY|nr:CbiX/SirB N-terminal domain-containing protein [Corynebacterium breve]WIM67460.1 CbiX/SirB N-terminal domain-containing protein [Corynebacterium breve]
MTALITLSHGSRHSEAADGIRALTVAAAKRLGVDAVESHLDFTEPTLSDAAVALAQAGHSHAIVVPLLFTDAFHAKVDVPHALTQAEEISGISLSLAATLGQGDDTARILATRVRQDAPAGATVVLYPVGTSDTTGAQATEDLAQRVGELAGFQVRVVPATGTGDNRGAAGLRAVAEASENMHLLPLFVTHGTLLDSAVLTVRELMDDTGVVVTHSAPLLLDLAPLVARRYREAVSSLVSVGR